DLGAHGHVDRDAVAGLDAERDEPLREAGDLGGKLGEGVLPAHAVLSEPDGRNAVRIALGPAMDAVPGDRELRADEPRRPYRPAREVHDLVPGRREVEPHVLYRR